MSKWAKYVSERFPIPVYLLLSGGLATSGQWTGGGDFDVRGFVLCMIGLLLFFSELRMMDELKDYKKDLVAHPERPLPRGLISVDEVRRVVHVQMLAMLGYAALLTALVGLPAGLSYLVSGLYLWLMYKEFYVGETLGKMPLVYAITHQIIMFPICAFAVGVSRPELVLEHPTLSYGTCALGAFFTYEVCRKLDPQAHPLLGTYLSAYGKARVALIVLVSSAVAFAGAREMEIAHWLAPFEIALIVSLILLWVKPSAYKVIEGLATLSLLVHLYAGAIQKFLSGGMSQ